MKRFLVLFLIVWFAVLAVNAQDTTPTPESEVTAVVVVPPVVDVPVEVTEVATDTPPVIVVNNPPATATENGVNASTLLYGLIIAILGGGSFAFILGRLQQSKPVLDAGEALYQGNVSPEMQQHIRQAFETVRDINNRLFDLVDKITDGKPNEVTLTPLVSSGTTKEDVKSEVTKQLYQALDGVERFQVGR